MMRFKDAWEGEKGGYGIVFFLKHRGLIKLPYVEIAPHIMVLHGHRN